MHFDRALVVSHVIEQAYDSSANFKPADGAIFADQDWGQVSAVAVSKVVGTSIVDPQEKRGVLLHRSAFVELMVEQAEQGSRRNLYAFRPRRHDSACARGSTHGHRLAHLGEILHAVGANRGVDRSHQKRGGNSFSADVADCQNQFVGTGGQKVVVVSTDRAGGTAEAMHFERLKLRDLAREKLRLNLLRDGELILQALLFFLLQDQLLDGGGHGVE